MRRKPIGGFQTNLSQTRIVLEPYEMMSTDGPFFLDPKALGILIRLAVYLSHGSRGPLTMVQLSRLAYVHVLTLKRHWPALEPFFETTEGGGLMVKSLEWLHVQTVSADRQSLRHLLERLVAFWGSSCAYCGVEAGELEIEHIVPVIRGGTDDLTNLTLACKPCNLKKRTQTAAEFGHPHIHEFAARIQ